MANRFGSILAYCMLKLLGRCLRLENQDIFFQNAHWPAMSQSFFICIWRNFQGSSHEQFCRQFSKNYLLL
jgi:hypothetical protein